LAINATWLTPERLETEYGISKKLQNRLRSKRNYRKDMVAKAEPIPFTKIGNLILYNKQNIENWLNKRTKGAKDAK